MADTQGRSEDASEEVSATLREMAAGISLIFQNAVDLYHEASALRAAGAFSRALFLHQISLEECAKIEMLGAWVTGELLGLEGDRQRQLIALTSHKAKNYTNAYLLRQTEDERNAKLEGRYDEAITAFKAQQADFHLESNTAKNAALYVDVRDDNFSSPKERITEEMVADIASRNEEFLSGARSKVEMVTRWADNPKKVQEMLRWFEGRLMELVTEHDDPGQGVAVVLEEMLEYAKESGYAEAMTTARKHD